MIELNNLNKKFQKNEVLKNLSIKIEKGESAVIIGRSGTGKSVLLKCLLGLLKPDKGKIKIGDKSILGKNYEYIGNKEVKIGMLFQGGALFDSLNIWRNISFSALQNKISEKECKKILMNKFTNYREYLELPEYTNIIKLLQNWIITQLG